MKIIVMGTGPFAVPTFQMLLGSRHEVSALYTRPIADGGKRRKTSENPMRDAGEAAGLPIFDPVDINASSALEQLRSLQPELFVVCDYGQILSQECLSIPRLGGVNLHGSLLPKYRGAAPVNWAIYHGDPETGITIIHMTPRLDGGPTLAQERLPIGPRETAAELEPRLAELGVGAVHRAIETLEAWDGQSPLGQAQDPSAVTRAPRLEKSDGQLDWERTAEQLVNQIRAFQPWPGSYTHWKPPGRKPPQRLILWQASVIDSQAARGRASEVVEASTTRLLVQTGQGLLSLERIQPAGKKPMPIADFLRGNPPAVGDRLG